MESARKIPRLTVVVPVFRSAATLSQLHTRVVASIEPLERDFELIFIEDDGGDGSWKIVESLARLDPRVRGLRLARNSGQHNALLCGIRAARGDTIVTIDDDLQNPPEEIFRLLSKLDEGYDVVYGTSTNLRHGFFRNQASLVTKLFLQGAMGAVTAGKVSAFRAFRAGVREGFADFKSPIANIDVLLTWGSTRFASVEVRHERRLEGVSGYTLRKLVNHALNMATGFSTAPLRVASVLGLAFGIFGFVILAYLLIRYLILGSSVPGFTFLASIFAIFSGAQLFALGIFGEYLARVYFRSMDRPTYTIREQTEPNE